MVSQGATLLELSGCCGFWCIHFCLDLAQFLEISGVGGTGGN